MSPSRDQKFILVTRPTRLEELVRRFNTIEQARFYVEHLGADFSDYLIEDSQYHQASTEAENVLGKWGLIQRVDRAFLPNFLFGPRDLVVALGQDGLVANTLKYLGGQHVLGVNPDPKRWDGKLLPFQVRDLERILPEVLKRTRPIRDVTMAEARLNTGLTIRAVNDLFIGPRTHGSARYQIETGGESERQSSSGVIVSTGLGSTGWFKSLMTGAWGVVQATGRAHDQGLFEGEVMAAEYDNAGRQGMHAGLVVGFPWDAEHLYFTVREPFPTRNTGASIVFGRITNDDPLVLRSEIAENGVIFSDGMEKDFLDFNSGTMATIRLAESSGALVV